ncbi:ATP-binding protein [Lipingzhangella sp. LS1_29]|uniref:ATP-binding protein n=1 Tax=Lipingzhangella rawalii TaxID=2055835 RepID=A0ABU2H4F9_9ACTN|nr:ATP-binding protein [Lipingzhangella rawalii]MDS1270193.1 ATP-binding protein [Lipingzhangella rawalii]
MHTADPFDTAELRRRVLSAWADSPARFRADANLEDDFALDGYRDRLLVELAQNAADAARMAGQPGRLHLWLAEGELRAANTGVELTAAGVESLATLRASAKRSAPDTPATVGRFGTGFAAVVPVAQRVTIASRSGTVTWDREWATAEVRQHAATSTGLATELDRRDGAVPLLRLPYPDQGLPPDGFTTEVRITLRATGDTPSTTTPASQEATRERIAEELRTATPALLLALPDLAEIRIETPEFTRELSRDSIPSRTARQRTHVRASGTASAGEPATQSTEWLLVNRDGIHSDAALAQRPREEQERAGWHITWALPVTEENRLADWPAEVARVVHAPTPSETQLHLPALLLGTFPLAADRRQLAMSEATDAMLDGAAEAYGELLTLLPAEAALDLIPEALPAGGEFDAQLRRRLEQRLPEVPFLRNARAEELRPRDAVALPGGPHLASVLGELMPGLLPGLWNHHRALPRLGVSRMSLAELADALVEVTAKPDWWRHLYAALRSAGDQGADLHDLGALPVPLADGRVVRGPRGLLLPSTDTTIQPEHLNPLGLRIVDPAAVDPLLERLGAVPASPTALLTDPMTRAAVESSLDAEDPEPIADCVLNLVAATDVTADTEPWLAELALRDDEGNHCPAGELLFPDSPLRDLLVDDAPFGVLAPDVAGWYSARALHAVGVTHGFTVFRAADVPLDHPEALHELPLDGIEEWAAFVTGRFGTGQNAVTAGELIGLRDIELVRPDAWPQALHLLTAPDTRAAIVTPTRIHRPDAPALDVPAPAAWWLGRHMRLESGTPVHTRRNDADEALQGLYPPAPDLIDPELATALGVRGSLVDLLSEPDGPDELLTRLADPHRSISRDGLEHVWRELARLSPDRLHPPEHTRGLWVDDSGVTTEIVLAEAEDLVVVDAPDLLPLLTEQAVILAPAQRATDLADVLDLSLASEEHPAVVTSHGRQRAVPQLVRDLLPDAPDTYVQHTELRVDEIPVSWRYVDGQVHAQSVEGLARGLAWASGAWPRRALVAEILHNPASTARLRDERALDPE